MLLLLRRFRPAHNDTTPRNTTKGHWHRQRPFFFPHIYYSDIQVPALQVLECPECTKAPDRSIRGLRYTG